jgi:hypothetical protein
MVGIKNILRQAFEEREQHISDLEEVLADTRRLTRELDIALVGEENAAEQASLCDLICSAEKLRKELNEVKKELEVYKRGHDIYKNEECPDGLPENIDLCNDLLCLDCCINAVRQEIEREKNGKP